MGGVAVRASRWRQAGNKLPGGLDVSILGLLIPERNKPKCSGGIVGEGVETGFLEAGSAAFLVDGDDAHRFRMHESCLDETGVFRFVEEVVVTFQVVEDGTQFGWPFFSVSLQFAIELAGRADAPHESMYSSGE